MSSVAEIAERRARLTAEVAARIATRPVLLPRRADVMFPNDAPQEVVENVVMILRRQASFLLDLCDALDTLVDAPLPVNVKIPLAPNASAGAGERRRAHRKDPV